MDGTVDRDVIRFFGVTIVLIIIATALGAYLKLTMPDWLGNLASAMVGSLGTFLMSRRPQRVGDPVIAEVPSEVEANASIQPTEQSGPGDL